MERVDYQTLLVQDLINLHKRNELDYNPWYQRRSVWKQSEKAYLINTLFERKPVPSLYVRYSLDIEAEKTVKQVVDGQQRIRAIIEYAGGEFPARHPNHRKKVKYSELSRIEVESYKLTGLSVGYLLGATDEDVIEILGRLNSVAKTLNAQEKRNARFSGEFKQFALQQAAKRLAIWRDLQVFTANAIARMDEVQFISDLALNLLNGLSDYSSKRLDDIYEKYDDDFPQHSKLAVRLDRVFSKMVSIKPDSIRDTVFCRPPLFFSLCMVFDSAGRDLSVTGIEAAISRIDSVLESDEPVDERKKGEAEFVSACEASTQRIKQRRIRDSFIRKQLGI